MVCVYLLVSLVALAHAASPGANATQKVAVKTAGPITSPKTKSSLPNVKATPNAAMKVAESHSSDVSTNVVPVRVSVKTEKPKATASLQQKRLLLHIEPKLKDAASDKKFFGPPFPADYPNDQRPVIKQSLMKDIKQPGKPYPALQSKHTFDTDYVKDENSDKGHWKAQFEYDAAVKKLQKQEAEEKAAQNRAVKEKQDANDAQQKADAAGSKADDAQKDADAADQAVKDAKKEEDAVDKDAKSNTDNAMDKVSSGPLEDAKKRLQKAEANYELEKKQFAQCKEKLEQAQNDLAAAKGQLAVMEAQSSQETQLWAQEKALRLNLKRAQKDAAAAKHKVAQGKLAAAEDARAEVQELYDAQKTEAEEAQRVLQQRRKEAEQARKALENARLRLQKLRGVKMPTEPAGKSNALQSHASAFVLAMMAYATMQ